VLDSLPNRIFQIQSSTEFEAIALEVFEYQAKSVRVYSNYLKLLNVVPSHVKKLAEIPFLPIRFFKERKIIAENRQTERVFMSSGTTGIIRSSHHLADLELYRNELIRAFKMFYGDPSKYEILALLPSYQEQGDSSLLFMVDELMNASGSQGSYYLDNYEELRSKLMLLESEKRQAILFGVSYALLDFVEKHPITLESTRVIETGGMKGRRKEMVRAELHKQLQEGFNCAEIHSEYGMTELTSQAYSSGLGIYTPPPWMRVSIRDMRDPFSVQPDGRNGVINVTDLANLYSCAFIETQDIGRMVDGRRFEVLGRLDGSEIRGCNLLVI
jgi:phenylacetate-coenzyme A ligase PaaK-like adenylate-forming protein